MKILLSTLQSFREWQENQHWKESCAASLATIKKPDGTDIRVSGGLHLPFHETPSTNFYSDRHIHGCSGDSKTQFEDLGKGFHIRWLRTHTEDFGPPHCCQTVWNLTHTVHIAVYTVYISHRQCASIRKSTSFYTRSCQWIDGVINSTRRFLYAISIKPLVVAPLSINSPIMMIRFYVH